MGGYLRPLRLGLRTLIFRCNNDLSAPEFLVVEPGDCIFAVSPGGVMGQMRPISNKTTTITTINPTPPLGP
jgi:hypothetical protein